MYLTASDYLFRIPLFFINSVSNVNNFTGKVIVDRLFQKNNFCLFLIIFLPLIRFFYFANLQRRDQAALKCSLVIFDCLVNFVSCMQRCLIVARLV